LKHEISGEIGGSSISGRVYREEEDPMTTFVERPLDLRGLLEGKVAVVTGASRGIGADRPCHAADELTDLGIHRRATGAP
jgi:hypothetical protein